MMYYTGKGDKGSTDIRKGRVKKDSEIIELIGSLDELNAFIGYSISKIKYKDIREMLKSTELRLYYISAIVSGYDNLVKNKKIIINEEDITEIEKDIGILSKEIKPLIKFLYPNGSEASCIVNICRAITRRTERRMVRCRIKNENALKYMNRLSSLLFVIFRVLNKRENIKEDTFN
ncbi:MAG: ATP--cobalamin adenosyltransferase [Candidatus Parvarchaeum acidophilus ARMAN-5]|uniref:ATP--cobalamin adenosyltransferase n=1 Tax=Candidatus Parvarchaeum acidophilus ARMAN-5 TaxID=662762 RepID=D6GVR2_PARA5|nr:MAG: ATP--cobalamin adenosyltransferase [Candidatus Parvarchaeum acidophilus ARMAN-5]